MNIFKNDSKSFMMTDCSNNNDDDGDGNGNDNGDNENSAATLQYTGNNYKNRQNC